MSEAGPSSGTDAQGRGRGAIGWVTIATVALLAAGGAARRPDGVAIGLPEWPAGLLLPLLLAIPAARFGLRAGSPGIGLVPALAIPIVGLWIPGVLALTGPPLFALVLACLALIAWREGLDRSGRWLLPVLLVFYALVAARVQTQVGAEGDEPHYLMVAESLLRDGDLELERDFREERYRAFTPRHLDPHFRVRGKNGEVFSLHAVGLSVLILPAYAAAGYAGASFLMALLAALLAREIRELVRVWTSSPRLAEGVGWLVGLSPPLFAYAGLIFTEIPAALVVAIFLRRSASLREMRAPWLGALLGGLAAALPWLNVRYAILTALLLAFAWTQRPRLRAGLALIGPVALSGVALALYHHALYGFWDPRRVYGTTRELALSTLPEGLPGLFLDQEFGLLVYAPIFALAPLGTAFLWRRSRALTAACVGLTASVVLVAASWPMWRGGFNPPARFLVPLLPVLALGLAGWLRRGPRIGACLLMGWSLWISLSAGLEPRLVHRDRDGVAPFFRERSGGMEWTCLLPSYVRPPTLLAYDRAHADRYVLSLLWLVALTAACGGRVVSSGAARRMAWGVAGLALAAAGARLVSTGVSEGRDAVRLLDHDAIALPGLRHVRDARWDTSALRWGPAYEPRARQAAVLGDRLPLGAGHYAIALGVERPPHTPAPDLVMRIEERPGRTFEHRLPLSPSAGALGVEWEIPESARSVTLELRDGNPLLLRSVHLEPLRD